MTCTRKVLATSSLRWTDVTTEFAHGYKAAWANMATFLPVTVRSVLSLGYST
jgi:hypothetical protein